MGLTAFVNRLAGTLTGGVAPPPEDSDLSVRQDDEQLFDEELLARLRKLVLLSRRAVAQGIAGEHKSRRKGASPEFADFKSYSHGDDYRRIDWNIYSRLDALFIRLSEVTTELTVHILVDSSMSMAWRSSNQVRSKFAYARRLAGSLAYVSLWHFDRIIITPFSTSLGAPFGPVQGRAQIRQTLSFLTSLQAGGATNIQDALQRYTSARHHPGVLIVISDLLSGEPESLRVGLRHARNRGWQVSVIHIVDAAELDPAGIVLPEGSDRPQTLELIDLEHGERVRLTANDELLQRYQEAVEQWKAELEQICIDERADYILLQTDWSFEQIVLSRLYEAGLVA